MALQIEALLPTPTSKPKTRLLRGLVRHVSAPARPPSTLHFPNSSEGCQNVNRQHSLPSPRPLSISPRSKPKLLSELSLTQSVVSRLRLDRDEWRTTAQIRERRLLSSERELKCQERAVAILEDQNAALRAGHEETVSAQNKLLARFRNAVTKHDKLVDQLNDSDRVIVRLKKSDRTKGKVWQRNLRLKATLGRYTTQAPTTPDVNTEAALLEALALANGRIEELESKGTALLEALSIWNNIPSEEDAYDGTARLVEAESTFQKVLEDETFKEQKENWTELLTE